MPDIFAKPGIVSVSVTTTTGTYKDLADFGWVVEKPNGYFSAPAFTFPTAEIPGALESVRLHDQPTGTVRPISFEGWVVGATMAAMVTNVRNLTGWCARAVAVKVSAHDSASYMEVKLARVTADWPGANAFGVHVTIEFESVVPFWVDTSATTATFTGGAATTALGTAISYPVVRITGALTNPTITVKNSSAVTVATLALTVVLANAAHYVEIDMAPVTGRTIVHNTGSNADGIALMTSGDFFGFDPANADTVTPTWGTIEVAVTAGSVSAATAIYRRRWY